MSVDDTIIVAVTDANDNVEIEVADPEAFHSVMAECGIKNVLWSRIYHVEIDMLFGSVSLSRLISRLFLFKGQNKKEIEKKEVTHRLIIQQHQQAIDNHSYRSIIESWKRHSLQQLAETIKVFSNGNGSHTLFNMILYHILLRITKINQ